MTFFADEDYQRYLSALKEATELHHCDVHAYVLMDNCAHFLMTPHTPNVISKTMQNLGRRYVVYVKCTCRRTGTL